MGIPAAFGDVSEIAISRCKSILRLVSILVFLAFALPLKAQQYSFRYYGTEDGLTSVAVKVLFQDRTGFLWAETQSRAFRYDDQRFQHNGPGEGLPHEVVLILSEAPDGNLTDGRLLPIRAL
jgi:ligand-binding sensor domain-containing protein